MVASAGNLISTRLRSARRRIWNVVRSFIAKVDLSDKQFVDNEKERNIKWSVDPFRKPRTGLTDGNSEEEENEKPPEWLELAGDLAWTATFSSLTSNTAITDWSAVWNYGVFFLLTWHLWATQTTYDIRYYTDDLIHRLCFVLQLAIYAILAACSGSFNVGWQLRPEWTEVFRGNATTLTFEAMEANQKNSITKSFRSINFWLFISRLLLLFQYTRVTWYRRRSGQWLSWRFYLMPLATLFAAVMFCICHLLIKKMPDSKPVAIAQVIMWGLAIASQGIAAGWTPNDHEGVLKSDGTMAPRLMSLTVIILGEGLNGICAALRRSVNSLNTTVAGQSVAILFILYFIWLIYFDGFKIKKPSSRARQEIWLYLHFPLHFALIMLLEGVKNVFICVNVLGTLDRVSEAFQEARHAYNATGSFPEHPKLEAILEALDTSWEEESRTLLDAMKKDDADPSGEGINFKSQFWRWYAEMVHKVVQLYNDEEDKEAEFKYQTFIQKNDTVIAHDYDSVDSPLFFDFHDSYVKTMAYTARWVVIVAGLLVLSMAVINTVQRSPKNRFAWLYTFNRAMAGVGLIILGSQGSSFWNRDWWMKQVPVTIVIFYGYVVFWDFFNLKVSVHYIRKLESLSLQLPTLQYDHEQSRRSESSPIGADAQGQKVSSDLLYAAEGEMEKSHGEKSISSSA